MAITTNDIWRNNYDVRTDMSLDEYLHIQDERKRSLDQSARQSGLSAAALGLMQQAAIAPQHIAKPQPEPNLVLLLLGDTE